MIAQWMLYSVVVGVCFGIAAMAGETLLRTNERAGRWVWVAALLATVALPLFNIKSPGVFFGSDVLPMVDVGALTVVGALLPGESAEVGQIGFGGVLLDRLLLAVWSVSSTALLLLVTWTTVKLVRERRLWLSATVGGRPVLVSADVGPAVVGIRSNAIVVPRWVLDLSEEEQRLVVLHEAEHARAGDLRLLLGGLLAVVLLPWNPAVWWQVRRLRLAAEADCDARVLRHGENVQSYGAFLLNICSRARSPAVAAVALSERKSPLLRRIELMASESRGRLARIGMALASGAIALTLACEIPAPAIAPEPGNAVIEPQQAVATENSNRVYAEFEVDEPPTLVVRPPFEYPEELLDELTEGVVRLEAVVDVDGNIEPGSLRVIETTDERFNDAALQYVSRVSFTPGKVDGEPVKVLIRMPVQFSIVGGD